MSLTEGINKLNEKITSIKNLIFTEIKKGTQVASGDEKLSKAHLYIKKIADNQFKKEDLSLASSGELLFKGVGTGLFVNVNNKLLSLGNSSRLNFPEEFDPNKLTKIDPNDGQLYYEGRGWLSGKYVNIDGSRIYLGTSSHISLPQGVDFNLIDRIDGDGELRYNGQRTNRYVNIDGQNLSIGSTSSINWPQGESFNKWRLNINDYGEIFYNGERTDRYVHCKSYYKGYFEISEQSNGTLW